MSAKPHEIVSVLATKVTCWCSTHLVELPIVLCPMRLRIFKPFCLISGLQLGVFPPWKTKHSLIPGLDGKHQWWATRWHQHSTWSVDSRLRSPLRTGLHNEITSGVLAISGLIAGCCTEIFLVQTSDSHHFSGIIVQIGRQKSMRIILGGIILDLESRFSQGAMVQPAGRLPGVALGHFVFAGIHDSLGVAQLCQGTQTAQDCWLVQAPSPGIICRDSVFEPMQTGLIAVDSLIPIGRGQRELIIGDRQTGKTCLGLDAIINQKMLSIFCAFVGHGQKSTAILDLFLCLLRHESAFHVTVIASPAGAAPMSSFWSVYRGAAVLECFMLAAGIPCLLQLDDLSKHAVSYREIYLLLRRPPGREAFPGEIFFVHSRLLERSAKVNAALGGGSLTALPVIETQAGDVSAYISTNVISITDGQIFLSSDLFLGGMKPAVDVSISVTRVGSSAQCKEMQVLAGHYKVELAQYNELKAFSQFASDLGTESAARIASGRLLNDLLKQSAGQALSTCSQITLLGLADEDFFADVSSHLLGEMTCQGWNMSAKPHESNE